MSGTSAHKQKTCNMLPNLSMLTVPTEMPKRDHDGSYSRGEANEAGKVLLDLDAGDRLKGRNYELAVAAMESKIEGVIRAWGASLVTNKELGMTINGHHFNWVVNHQEDPKPRSYEFVLNDRPDRLIPKGRGKPAIADAREKLRVFYEEDRDLFYTVMIGLMASQKVQPHFAEIE